MSILNELEEPCTKHKGIRISWLSVGEPYKRQCSQCYTEIKKEYGL